MTKAAVITLGEVRSGKMTQASIIGDVMTFRINPILLLDIFFSW